MRSQRSIGASVLEVVIFCLVGGGGGEKEGELFLCHNDIYLILPQPRLCSILMTPPPLGSEFSIVPLLYSLLATADPPIFPLKSKSSPKKNSPTPPKR